MNGEILHIEELSINAHPSLRTFLYDGWILRFSNGYTNRANSVNPLYASRLPLREKIAACERIYFAQGLPAVFKLTDDSPAGLDNILGENGYKIVTPTLVMTLDIARPASHATGAAVRRGIDPQWQNAFFALNGVADPAKRATAAAMLGHIQNDVLCAKIERDGEIVACGLSVVERGFAGLFDIVVAPAYRGQGLGRAVCASLLDHAAAIGASKAYLQVVAANAPAKALYEKLGFQKLYGYWYRVKREGGS